MEQFSRFCSRCTFCWSI